MPPSSFPPPQAKRQGCALQSLYLAFLWWGARGWPSPAGRGARLCAGTTGSLNALKSCSVPGRIRPGPPHTGGFRAKPSWRRGLLLRGRLAPASPHCPARRDGRAGGGQAGSQEEMSPLVAGHGVIGECPPPITEVSATGLPSSASQLGGGRDGSDGGGSGVWLLLLGSIPGGDRQGAALQQQGGCQRRGKPPSRLASPTSTGPAAAALCRR